MYDHHVPLLFFFLQSQLVKLNDETIASIGLRGGRILVDLKSVSDSVY